MKDNPSDLDKAATAEGLPVAPSASLTIEAARVPLERSLIDGRVVLICAWSIALAISALLKGHAEMLARIAMLERMMRGRGAIDVVDGGAKAQTQVTSGT